MEKKELHNLVIRRDLLLIYIFECKFKKIVLVLMYWQNIIFIIQMKKY